MTPQQERLHSLPVPGFQRRWGQKLLNLLKGAGIVPDFVNRSHEGNLLIEWKVNGNYCMAEMYDDMEVVFLYRDGKSIDAWDLTSATCWPKIEAYLPKTSKPQQCRGLSVRTVTLKTNIADRSLRAANHLAKGKTMTATVTTSSATKPQPGSHDAELLAWVLARTPVDRLRGALKDCRFQSLYETHEKRLLAEFFGGSRLRMSVVMARVFRPYHVQTYAGEVTNLEMKLSAMQRVMKLRKREGRTVAGADMDEYNALVTRLNDIYRPGNELVKLHRKVRKQCEA